MGGGGENREIDRGLKGWSSSPGPILRLIFIIKTHKNSKLKKTIALFFNYIENNSHYYFHLLIAFADSTTFHYLIILHIFLDYFSRAPRSRFYFHKNHFYGLGKERLNYSFLMNSCAIVYAT